MTTLQDPKFSVACVANISQVLISTMLLLLTEGNEKNGSGKVLYDITSCEAL